MAFITYSPSWHGHMCAVLPHAKALKIKQQLEDMENLGTLSEEQLDYLQHVKAIYLNPQHGQAGKKLVDTTSQAKANYRSAVKPTAPITNDNMHPGVYQSKDMALPESDR